LNKNVFVSNYKTTITGLAGILVTILSIFGIVKDQNTLSLISNIATGILGIAFALLGYFSPDADKVIQKIQEGENIVEKVSEIIKAGEQK
jgi:lantibiotic modifying enzyme